MTFIRLVGVYLAIESLSTHGLRSVLAALGIAVGVASVACMFMTIDGLGRAVESSMSPMGTNLIYIEKWPWMTSEEEWWQNQNRKNITKRHATYVQRHSRYAVSVAPYAGRAIRAERHGAVVTDGFLRASTPEFPNVEPLQIQRGRFYTLSEYRSARGVCVIGAEVASRLFSVEDPIGKHVRIGGVKCRVIGILEKQGRYLGMISLDTQIHIPLTTYQSTFGLERQSITIQVRVGSSEQMEEAYDELTGLMRTVRGLDPLAANDFAVNTQEALQSTIQSMKIMTYIAGLFLTVLSLLVGVFGVANVMFISVRERTSEIGVHRAHGARRVDIFLQFISEATLISLAGGVIGLLGVVGLSTVIAQYLPVYVSFQVVFVSIILCMLCGGAAGYIPARRASYIRPVEALGYS